MTQQPFWDIFIAAGRLRIVGAVVPGNRGKWGKALVIRLIICDDSMLMRAGLRVVLGNDSGVEVVYETGSPQAAASRAARLLPDVVLAGSPGNALTIAREVRAAQRSRPADAIGVIALITHDEEEGVLDAVRGGALGVVRRDAEPADVVRAVRAVARGGASLTPVVTRRVLDLIARVVPSSLEQPASVQPLSHTELRVLGMLAEGADGQEIACALRISPTTVRSHVHHMLTKLGLSNRAQAVAFAYRYGLVRPPA